MPTVLDMLERPELRDPVLQSLRHSRTVPDRGERSGGHEDRLLLADVTWEDYEAIDTALGENRPGPRLYYLDGDLEIMSTSQKHEELKKWLATMLEQFFIKHRIHAYPRGQTTLKIFKEAGAEPDESWTFGERKDIPDLVLEIALSSGGLPKLEIYERFAVPEVWFWRRGGLEVWTLETDGYHGPESSSRLLPELPLDLLAECARIPDWMEAIERFRKALDGAQ